MQFMGGVIKCDDDIIWVLRCQPEYQPQQLRCQLRHLTAVKILIPDAISVDVLEFIFETLNFIFPVQFFFVQSDG